MCSTASARATRSPFLDASFSWSMMTARLGRLDGVTMPCRRQAESIRAARQLLSFHRHVELFPVVGRHRLDGDLPSDRSPHSLESVHALGLQVVRGVRMRAYLDLLSGAVLRARLDLAEDLGRERRVGLHDTAALARRARGTEQ